MKIIYVSPMYPPALGGAEHHLKAISEGFASRGHEVTVLTANICSTWDLWPGHYGNLPKMEVIQGVKVIRFLPDGGLWGKALDRWLWLKGGWRSASFLLSPEGVEMLSQSPRIFMTIPHILRFDADIVASMNWYWPPAYHAYLARRLKRFTLVGIPLFHTAQPWCERSIYKRMLPTCDAIVVNTSYEGQFAQQRGARRVEVAGVGVNPKEFERRNGAEVRARYGLGGFPVVGFVGRQEATKGALKLLQAMNAVWKWNGEVRLVLAGPRSPRAPDMEAAIDSLSRHERARVVRIDEFSEADKASIFDAFDVFALPSTEESFGIAYLEAWLCRKPVIGANIGPIRCVINEGIDGLLVDPNDPQDVARAIIELLSDADKREKMGNSGYGKTISQFTWDRVIDKIERLYLDLLVNKPQCRQVFMRAEP